LQAGHTIPFAMIASFRTPQATMSETISHVAGDASRSALHHVVALPGAVKRASDQGHVKLPNSRKDEKLPALSPELSVAALREGRWNLL